MATLEELQSQIRAYSQGGFAADVARAAREAQEATRQFIMRTHPSTAFGGINILYDYNNKTVIHKGTYEVKSAGVVNANIYADYFARWYNTGAFGRIIRSGKYKGRRGPSYPARGNYFAQNEKAIEEYFTNYMLEYLRRNINL